MARRRSIDAGVDIEFVHDDFDRFTTQAEVAEAFEVVASSFGVIFAPDPTATARALASVTAPGGTIAICAWASTGLFGVDRTAELAALMPPAPAGLFDRPWSDGTSIADMLAGTGVALVEQRCDSIGLVFESVEDTIDEFERWSGPWQTIFAHFRDTDTVDAARAALVEDFSRYLLSATSGIRLRADYVVSVLRKGPAAGF